MDVFDAAERYKQEGRQLIILAGKDYGSGSSRDWAAKGPWILVSKRVINEMLNLLRYVTNLRKLLMCKCSLLVSK